MGETVNGDCLKSRIRQDYLFFGVGGRIAVESSLQIRLQKGAYLWLCVEKIHGQTLCFYMKLTIICILVVWRIF